MLCGVQSCEDQSIRNYRRRHDGFPSATIHADRNGVQYEIQQTIDPITGVMPGDECWIAYNERTHQALIIKYASI
ncbi:hypothetical protein [Rossellomorea marisflavi]|uniref:Uncharacterized protein n=1 Tax=Rossellomorea marisflavi TaxID=189381 RepID=A0A165LBW1_9BACI|nr:hypothetical protein [Rossellomorea marisflavi]KZE51614.1 hypothetical protein AV649_14040 [Rossellomorea marisflavi]